MAENKANIIAQDFNILGVEALRRKYLEAENRPITLQCHRDLLSPDFRALYEDLLKRSLQWLKPQEVREIAGHGSRDERVLHLMLEELRRSFPKTSERLEAPEATMREYLREFPWPGGLLTGHFRYFPWWLSQRPGKTRPSRSLVDLAQREWIGAFLQFADFGGVSLEKSFVRGNPSLQFQSLAAPLPEYQLREGLYAYAYDSIQARVTEARLDVYEAALLDLLQEDRKFSREQLLEQAALVPLAERLDPLEWEKRFSKLTDLGMILTMPEAPTK